MSQSGNDFHPLRLVCCLRESLEDPEDLVEGVVSTQPNSGLREVVELPAAGPVFDGPHARKGLLPRSERCSLRIVQWLLDSTNAESASWALTVFSTPAALAAMESP